MLNKILTLVLILVALGGVAAAQVRDAVADSTTPEYAVRAERVRYKSGADTVRGLLYIPDAPGKRPGLVAIHEWWGLNAWVKESAERLAKRGYAVLAIDLYRGEVAEDAEEAHELMRGVPADRATRDLQTAVEYLRSRREVDRDRIASIGWCMGGGYSLQTAQVVPDLAACVVCYGRLVTEDESIAQINAPVLGIFGAEDRGIPAESVHKFQKQARELGRHADMQVYEGAGHAFMNPNNEKGFDQEATADAWRRIFAFLANTFKPQKSE